MQVAGKDNLRQQTAMWQAMLMSAGIINSTQVLIFGFITSGGQKMSKSLGNVVHPYDLVKKYGTDAEVEVDETYAYFSGRCQSTSKGLDIRQTAEIRRRQIPPSGYEGFRRAILARPLSPFSVPRQRDCRLRTLYVSRKAGRRTTRNGPRET